MPREHERRSRAAEALHALLLEEARWQAVLDTLRDGLVSIDETGHITLFNRAAEDIFGYGAEELIGQKVNLLMPPPYSEEHDRYIEAYRTTRVPQAIGRIREVWGRRKSGEIFPLELSVSEVEVGGEVLFSAVLRDVSERRRTESALRQMSKVFMDAADAIIIKDLDGYILDLNAEAERAYGWRRDELIGKHLKTLIPAERHGLVDEYLERCRHGEDLRGVENLRRDKQGNLHPVLLTFSLLSGENGEPAAIATIAKDMTERKRSEAERLELLKHLQQRERLADIGAMTAKVAHDLGNPVAGVSMATQRILRRIARTPTEPVESVRQAAEHIADAARRLEALIGEFKEIARGQQLDLSEVDLAALLGEIFALWEPQAAARGITLSLDASRHLPRIRADADKLRRVFDNLVKNAIEAVEHGPGQVRISTSLPTDGKVHVAVGDSGPGIAPGLDVFGLFETTKPQGTGLGLPICKQIVDAHGGGIRFANGGTQGTVFHVDLPIEQPNLRSDPRPLGG